MQKKYFFTEIVRLTSAATCIFTYQMTCGMLLAIIDHKIRIKNKLNCYYLVSNNGR